MHSGLGLRSLFELAHLEHCVDGHEEPQPAQEHTTCQDQIPKVFVLDEVVIDIEHGEPGFWQREQVAGVQVDQDAPLGEQKGHEEGHVAKEFNDDDLVALVGFEDGTHVREHREAEESAHEEAQQACEEASLLGDLAQLLSFIPEDSQGHREEHARQESD